MGVGVCEILVMKRYLALLVPPSSRYLDFGYDSYTIFSADVAGFFGYKYGQVVDFPAVLMGDRDVEVLVTSADVVHSWCLNGLGVKVDAIPGRVNGVHLRNLRPGFVAWGGCSEMCGVNHWQMGAEAEVLSPVDFYLWIFVMVIIDTAK